VLERKVLRRIFRTKRGEETEVWIGRRREGMPRRRQEDGIKISTTKYFKSAVFWDITPWSPLKVNRRFGGTYCLHLQGRRISEASNQRERVGKRSSTYIPAYIKYCYAYGVTIDGVWINDRIYWAL
jgi:hypothetical protein